jgi:hypothetical protein
MWREKSKADEKGWICDNFVCFATNCIHVSDGVGRGFVNNEGIHKNIFEKKRHTASYMADAD